jgi:hypothetical protein
MYCQNISSFRICNTLQEVFEKAFVDDEVARPAVLDWAFAARPVSGQHERC